VMSPLIAGKIDVTFAGRIAPDKNEVRRRI
jgi:hypothetical protein